MVVSPSPCHPGRGGFCARLKRWPSTKLRRRQFLGGPVLLASSEDARYPPILLHSHQKCPWGHLFLPGCVRDGHQLPNKITFNLRSSYLQMMAESFPGAIGKALAPSISPTAWNLEPPSKSTCLTCSKGLVAAALPPWRASLISGNN